MSDESYVQVATDGTGKKIRNLALTEQQGPDTSGNAQADLTRMQQVVTLADKRGETVDQQWQSDVLAELRAIHAALDAISLALA